jgi:hypothetical protein
MPNWIKASIIFFTVVGAALAISVGLVWSAEVFGGLIVASVSLGLVAVGVPLLFFLTLR